MVGFSMDVGSFQVVVGNLSAVASADVVLDSVGDAISRVLFDAVRANVSATDHTLADLRRLDHPYARRHGSIQIHGGSQTTVHKHTVQLLSSLRVEKLPSANSPTGEAYAVWFDVAAAPHAAFVVQGTRYMLPRDVLWATTQDPAVRKSMMRATTKVLGKALRTKANIRFGNS
jgi:hypothetical protein